MTESQITVILDRLARMEEQAKHRAEEQTEIKSLLSTLVADFHKREGREAILRVAHVEDREDKWQTWTWVRAFLPVGVLTAVWASILEIMRRLVNGG